MYYNWQFVLYAYYVVLFHVRNKDNNNTNMPQDLVSCKSTRSCPVSAGTDQAQHMKVMVHPSTRYSWLYPLLEYHNYTIFRVY